MKKPNHLAFYLLLNVLVSAATTLAVLWVWDTYLRPTRLPEVVMASLATLTPVPPTETAQPASGGSSSDAPSPSQVVIEIGSVVGAGDIEHEVVLLRRAGDGDLNLTGWQLTNQRGDAYTFPELILYKGGGVQVFTTVGTDTATGLYWNRADPAWQSGGVATLLDPQGNVRATYTVP